MGASSVSSPKRAVLAGPSPLLNRPRTGVQGTVRGSTGGQAGANESFEQALRSSGFDKSPFTARVGKPLWDFADIHRARCFTACACNSDPFP